MFRKNLLDVLEQLDLQDKRAYGAINPVHTEHTEDKTTITISAPGVNADEVEVTLADGVLRVVFENEKKLGYGEKFDKSWVVMSGVGEKDLTAFFHSGILVIEVKKPKKPKHKIEVKKAN